MSDTSNFGFGKFVPGFDFLQSLAKGASTGIPKLPNLSSWVAPTLSVEELEKRIDELKAVQFWLEQNSRALTATVQALEVQKMTLATLKGMNVSMGDVANAFKIKPGDAMMDSVQKAADSMSGAAEAMASAAARATGRAATADSSAAAKPAADAEPASSPTPEPAKSQAAEGAAPQMVDPMQWWGALTSQFQQIASSAMKDAAQQAALDPTKNVAAGLAKDTLKTATDMAAQFAATSLKTMQAAKPKPRKSPAASAPTPAAKKSPAKKAAARPSAKSARSSTSKTTPRKTATRKSAG